MERDRYAALKLENQLCFPLYAASREVVKQYHACLSDLNLTYTQYIVMMILWDREESSVKELGSLLYLDSGTLTPVLKSLEAKGYVRRYRSSEDERVLHVQTTEAGQALRERALRVPESIAPCIRLDPEESAELYRLLYKVLDGLEER